MEIKTPQERRDWIDTLHPAWVPRTLSQHLDHIATLFPDSPLVITQDGTYSYTDIVHWSTQLAAGLVNAGIRPGDHIALIMGNYPEFVALKFAIARVGAVAVPINFALRAREIDYILKQSDAVMLITMDCFMGRDYLTDLDMLAPGWDSDPKNGGPGKIDRIIVFETGESVSRSGSHHSLATLADGATTADQERLQSYAFMNLAGSNADIIYTSGTTGTPKGVMLEHDMLLRAAFASAYTIALVPETRMLFSLPMYHVFGYVECLVAATFVGGAIIPQLSFDPTAMIEAAERHQVTEIVTVPLMTGKILEVVKERGFDCPSLVTSFNSGGNTPESMWGEIRQYLGAPEIITGYGMSETTASTSCTFPEGDDSYLLSTNGKLKYAGIAGDSSLDGVLAVYQSVDPESGTVLPWGEKGELLVRGPAVTRGYYNKPDETALAFTDDGWLRTGDVGTVTHDGYITLKGRVKEAYRCGGEMVMPKEIEDLLNLQPGVALCVVVGLQDEKMGEIGCACIVADAAQQPDLNQLRTFCTQNLAKFKVPKHFHLMDEHEIPMTATGRPQKFKLATSLQLLFEKEVSYHG
jgi:fatty-acyl-CoA synthase